MQRLVRALTMLLGVLAALPLRADDGGALECERCREPVEPFRIHGDTYYVGSRGASSILITSGRGHILIDSGLPGSGAMIADQLQTLGYSLRDVKLIVLSHAHPEHAGALAELARESGARLAMSPWNADAVRAGQTGPSDPQAALKRSFPRYSMMLTVRDGEVLAVGPLRLRAHFTPGHTPGGTSWSWRSCDERRCVDIVYADTLTPQAAPGFRFSASETYPQALADFERSFRVLEGLACQLVLSPRPDTVALWQRREAQQDQPSLNPYIEPNACRTYADIARGALERRLLEEQPPRLKPWSLRSWFGD